MIVPNLVEISAARQAKTKKVRERQGRGPFSILNPAATYSPIRRPHSTIGAGGLNDRVPLCFQLPLQPLCKPHTGKRRRIRRALAG